MTNELSRAPDAGTSEIEGREAPHAKLEWADASNLSVRVSGDFDRIEAACGNKAVMTALIEQAAALALHGKQIDQKATDFTLGYLDAMQPEDPAEAPAADPDGGDASTHDDAVAALVRTPTTTASVRGMTFFRSDRRSLPCLPVMAAEFFRVAHKISTPG